eukprot:4160402-Pyramimonas_sp.AAC.1
MPVHAGTCAQRSPVGATMSRLDLGRLHTLRRHGGSPPPGGAGCSRDSSQVAPGAVETQDRWRRVQ